MLVQIINSLYLIRANDICLGQLIADFITVGQTYGKFGAHDGGST
ncbi:MAG: hypothetical protein ACPF9Z_08845 [Paracoccaceae bacterium]